ncbi:chemotaxis protein CheW [Paenibacillus flagellatus]|uniref:Chemotaxis protein CheW n=1 Tax=Paenibacillus flagellatus TaxID=2211139 RepID=A0A2V5KJS8_9BACL|nr:chemotaxis protein CheW [Paenibacillus flagellatus]PYI50727.1 chemotaxis protein CheW [Paenibacillus flagellatus]
MSVPITSRQFVEIRVGTERLALHIQDIHEIIRVQPLTEVPNSKPYLIGVINLRGKVAPIVSLRKRFGLPEAADTKATRIVVVNYQESMVGLIVDQVYQVTSFEEIQPPPERTGGTDHGFIEGIGKSGDELVSILKLDRILQ